MIKKSGYVILGISSFSVLEALLIGLEYFIIFSLVLLFTVISDILIFNEHRGRNMDKISVRRTVEEKYQRKGKSFPVKLAFSNDSKMPVAFHYYDTLSDVFTIDGPSQGYMVLKPGESRTLDYVLSSSAIGKYLIGPVIIYSEDAMKLCIKTLVIEKANEVKISPSLSDIHGIRSDLISNIKFTTGVHRSRIVGQGYNFYGVRQYTDSDDFRYIAWSRYGLQNGDDIYIKQMEEERQLDVYFVIDYSSASNFGSSEARMFDRIVIDSINAGYSVLKNHDGVGFIVFNGSSDYFIKATRSDDAIQRLERLVAEINPQGRFDLFRSLERISELIRKNALVLVITPLSFSEEFNVPKVSIVPKGKRVTLFFLEPSNFVKLDGRPKSQAALLKSAIIKKNHELNAISYMLNRLGLMTYVSSEKDLFRRLVTEYQYGKVVR
jgi:uncharacterized protein (DUF58 family)